MNELDRARMALEPWKQFHPRSFEDMVHAVAAAFQRDKCENCHGERGGIAGNENIVDGKILCDYCHVELKNEQTGKATDNLHP